MNVLWILIAAMLGVAALLELVRLVHGPSILDRAVALDVLLVSALTGLGAYAAFHRDPTILPTLLVLALLGFVGSVSIAKFVARRSEEHTDTQAGGAGAAEGPPVEEGKAP